MVMAVLLCKREEGGTEKCPRARLLPVLPGYVKDLGIVLHSSTP